jgi:hypothetical protein
VGKICSEGIRAAKAKFDRYPSAYANMFASKYCQKIGKKKKGTKGGGKLKKWRDEKWIRITSSGNIAGECGTSKNKKNPDRCLPMNKAKSLSKSERATTAKKKKRLGKNNQFVRNTKEAKVRVKR